MNINHIELTEDLVRGGKLYPKGTRGELIGMLSTNLKEPVSLGIRLADGETVEVTRDIKNCTDFKYKKYAY